MLSRVPIINQDSGGAPLFYRDLSDVGFLIFQPAFWGRGLPPRYSGNPVWVESPCPLRGGMGMGTL